MLEKVSEFNFVTSCCEDSLYIRQGVLSEPELLFNKNNQKVYIVLYLCITIFLAVVFMGCQFYEYVTSSFCIADGVFSTNFYMITGLHGFHVVIGIIMILISFARVLEFHFTADSFLGLEFSV